MTTLACETHSQTNPLHLGSPTSVLGRQNALSVSIRILLDETYLPPVRDSTLRPCVQPPSESTAKSLSRTHTTSVISDPHHP
jgi:hypothetical protein